MVRQAVVENERQPVFSDPRVADGTVQHTRDVPKSSGLVLAGNVQWNGKVNPKLKKSLQRKIAQRKKTFQPLWICTCGRALRRSHRRLSFHGTMRSIQVVPCNANLPPAARRRSPRPRPSGVRYFVTVVRIPMGPEFFNGAQYRRLFDRGLRVFYIAKLLCFPRASGTLRLLLRFIPLVLGRSSTWTAPAQKHQAKQSGRSGEPIGRRLRNCSKTIWTFEYDFSSSSAS